MATSLRALMIAQIKANLIRNTEYCEHLQAYADPKGYHDDLIIALHSTTDRMLLSLYDRLQRDPTFFVLGVDRPNFLSIKVGRYFGGMSESGEVHT